MASDHYFRAATVPLGGMLSNTVPVLWDWKANVWWDSWCLSSWKLNVSEPPPPNNGWAPNTKFTHTELKKKTLTGCSSLLNILCPPCCLLIIEWEHYWITLVALFSALLTTSILNVAWSNVEEMNGEPQSLITGLSWCYIVFLHVPTERYRRRVNWSSN